MSWQFFSGQNIFGRIRVKSGKCVYHIQSNKCTCLYRGIFSLLVDQNSSHCSVVISLLIWNHRVDEKI